MSRELPRPGEKWRHYKLKDGEEYVATVFVIAQVFTLSGKLIPENKSVIYSKRTNWLSFLELAKEGSCVVFDTESNQIFYTHLLEDLALALIPSGLKWKESNVSENTAWARPLDSFMGVVSFPHGVEWSNFYRFERIEQKEATTP